MGELGDGRPESRPAKDKTASARSHCGRRTPGGEVSRRGKPGRWNRRGKGSGEVVCATVRSRSTRVF